MKLLEAVQQIEVLDSDLIIYARRPWNFDSEVELIAENSNDEDRVKAAGFRYFIEVPMAKEFLEDWRANVIKNPTTQQCCERLIRYAKYDA